MGVKRRLTRRRLLVSGAAVGGALVLGFALFPAYQDHRRRRTMRNRALETGEFRPNAWLAIHPDGRIVFTLDRVEMGQGTMTSHTMMIAEELEVEPRAIQVEFAIADRRYDHPVFGVQLTGASSSTKTSWEPLARAGAAAREMLRAAAAADWGVPIGECEAIQGTIVHRPSGRTRDYGSLTRLAAEQPIPDPPLKRPEAYKTIGKSIGRLDARMKVDGSGIFGIDVVLPEMLTAVVVRPPTLGASVKSFDGSGALARPGVRAVFEIPSGVAVVADGYWKARSAAEAVRVAWSGGRPELDSARISAELEALTRQPGKVARDEGDVDAAFARGGAIVEAAYEAPHLAHAPMEPMNCTAHVTPERCEIWAPTQAPGVARELVSEALGWDRERVIIHTTLLGGGFGRRLVQDFVLEAAHIAQRLGKPVKVLWSREDDMCHSIYRPHVRHAIRAALDASGRPVAWLHRVAAPSLLSPVLGTWLPAMTPDAVPRALDRGLAKVASGVFGRAWMIDETSVEGASDMPYAIANLRVELSQHDPGVPIGFWRSVGHSHSAFAVESFMDELAAAAHADPYEFRHGLLAQAPRARNVLEIAARQAGWGSPLPVGRARGIAQHRSFESYVAQVAEVSVESGAARVHRVVCAVDCGRVIHPDIVKSQMESGIVFGLSAALKQRISFLQGRVEQSNFHDYPMLRMLEMPEVEVIVAASEAEPSGVGEPGVPPIAPAVANAIAAATGKRIRRLPLEPELSAAG